MKVNIQSPHFKASEELTSFVTEKVNTLSRFNDRILSSEVCLKIENSSTADNKVCEVRLNVPGNDLFAKSQCETFEEATLQTVDALKEQITRRKD